MNTSPKEPVRKPWIWVVTVLILLASIPWYLPKGSIGFVLLGVPSWMLLSMAFTLIMCGYLSWLCFTEWDVVESEEEGTERGYAEGAQGTRPGNEGE